MPGEWTQETNISITVCDRDSKILEMNRKAIETFAGYGGESLIGQNLKDCHPEEANKKIDELMENQSLHAYTIEKNGEKKLIYQVPWFQNGEYRGIVELSLPLPSSMRHFNRDKE